MLGGSAISARPGNVQLVYDLHGLEIDEPRTRDAENGLVALKLGEDPIE
jgi:hypothetical protein